MRVAISGQDPAIQDRPEDWGKPAGFHVVGKEVEVSDVDWKQKAVVEEYLSRLTGFTVELVGYTT